MRHLMRHPDSRPMHAPASLASLASPRWALLALALVAAGTFALAPRLSTTGHAAPSAASKNMTVAARLRALRAGAQTPVFTLTSPDFEANGPLPTSAAFNQPGCVGTTGQGQNLPPLLKWKNGQSGFTGFPTLSYALTVADYDAPVGGGFHHWVIYNIPGTATELDAATIAASTPGMNDFGLLGYGGPCPPQDGQLHHYIFTLYALDVANLGAQGMTYTQLADAINAAVDSHGVNFVVNGATVRIGTFENP
jgi:Raf kinase inhibitor-like YbhB/YbcL family protein